MNKKAIALALALAGATTVAMAQQGKPADGGKAPQNFTERKQHMLERMDQRIQAMQKARECLAQAQDEQAARGCRQHGPREGGGMRGGMDKRGDMGGEHMARHTAMHQAEQAQGGDADHQH
jgi:hypothetical protein